MHFSRLPACLNVTEKKMRKNKRERVLLFVNCNFARVTMPGLVPFCVSGWSLRHQEMLLKGRATLIVPSLLAWCQALCLGMFS